MSITSVYTRAEMIAKAAGLKLMVVADFGLLPPHLERWKNYRDKKEIQFLHVLPCRCGKLLSKNTICSCSEHIISTYQHRNRRHFHEEGYSMHLEVSSFDLEEYQGFQEDVTKRISEIADTVNTHREVSPDAKEILDSAKKRWEDLEVEKIKKIANAIAAIDRKEHIEKVHVLEALSYRYRISHY